MDLQEYQREAHKTAVYPTDKYLLPPDVVYAIMGLVGEAGELANLVKKALRGDYGEDPMDNKEFTTKLVTELGGIQWYLAENATILDINLEAVAQLNIKVLRDRAERGQIQGSGDDR
jgi:hypothetical protein